MESLEEDISELTKQRNELQTKVKSIMEIYHESEQKLHRCVCGDGGGGGVGALIHVTVTVV